MFTVHVNVQKTLPPDLHCLIYKVSCRKDTALQSNMFTLVVFSGSSDVSCMLIRTQDLADLRFLLSFTSVHTVHAHLSGDVKIK